MRAFIDNDDSSNLSKDEISPGSVLWLPKDADERDPESYRNSKLDFYELDHPVMVIDTMRPDHKYLRVCVMTGTFKSYRDDIPVYHDMADGENPSDERCKSCKTSHRPTEDKEVMFYETENVRMPKHSHVVTGRVYEVSIDMLRKEWHELELGLYTFDYRSIQVALESVQGAVAELDKSSWILRQWPAPSPLQFEPPMFEDFDPKAGYTTGYLPGEAPSEKLAIKKKTCVSSRKSTESKEEQVVVESGVKTALSNTKPASHTDTNISATRVQPHAARGRVNPSKDALDNLNASSSSLRTTGTAPKTSQHEVSTTSSSPTNAVTSGKHISGDAAKITSSKSKTLEKSINSLSIKTNIVGPTPAVVKPMQATSNTVSSLSEAKTKPQTAAPASTAPVSVVTRPKHLYKPGYIVWLSRGEYEDNRDPTQHVRVPHNRPCVVLNTISGPRSDRVLLCGITTLAGESLASVREFSAEEKNNYLAITHKYDITLPMPFRPDQHVRLVQGLGMPRRDRISYINTNQAWWANPEKLARMWESDFLGQHRLEEESLKKVQAKIRLNLRGGNVHRA